MDTRFRAENELLSARFHQRGSLVMAHRGTSGGSIPENSSGAVIAAVRSGADVVEIDVTGSRDGAYFVHHDGMEGQHLSTTTNLALLTTDEIASVSHRWLDQPDKPVRLERLTSLLEPFAHSDVLFQIDRSWPWWPDVLDELDTLDMTPQLVVKCPAAMKDAVDALAAVPAKIPYVAMCRTLAETELHLGRDDLNLIGVEISFAHSDSPFLRPETIARLHEQGLTVWVNTLVLPNGVPLAGEYDDARALYEGPDAAWGRLLDLGVDVIQTDWPWLLAAHRDERTAQRV
jgi:glycerophosphoryl diester phosphodiesterase